MKEHFNFRYIYVLLLLCFVSFSLNAQEMELSGTITDGTTGNPVAGARVFVREYPMIVVQSDENGSFHIKTQKNQNLVIELNDGRKKIVSVNSNEMQVVIDQTAQLVQWGFGITRTFDENTAAAGFAGKEKLSGNTVVSPSNALYGRIAGLTVMQNGGLPWSNEPDMYIRGKNTFLNSGILVLVDGFERPLSTLNINEIDNITVLKDAASLALYGQQGANGVLLVTTKRGQSEKSRVTVDYQRGITQAFRLPEFLNGYQYAKAVNQALVNDGLPARFSSYDLQDYQSQSNPLFFPDVNWKDQVLKDFGNKNDFNVSFTGGSKTARYYAMGGYQNEQGLFRPVNENDGYSTQLNYDKFNFRTNLDIDLSKSTLFQVNLGGHFTNSNQPDAGANNIFSALYATPSGEFPVKNFDQTWGGTSDLRNNPVAMVSSTGYSNNIIRGLLADAKVVQKLDFVLKGLSAEVAVNYDNSATFTEGKSKSYKYEKASLLRDANGNVTDTTLFTYGTESGLSYASSLSYQYRNSGVWAKLNYDGMLAGNNLGVTLLYNQNKVIYFGQYNTYMHQGVSALSNYNIRNKYVIDANLTYGGTNVLSKKNHFALYPAVSGAWILSNEDFLKNSQVIRYLKVRASWGITGNDQIPQNISEQNYGTGGTYYFKDASSSYTGYYEGRLGAPNLKSEKGYKSNAGLDASFFGKLDLSADVFYNRQTGIPVTNDGIVSNVLGIGAAYANAGIVENKGFEIDANWHQSLGNNFHYFAEGQVSFARNKIVEMNEAYKPEDYLRQTGKTVGQWFGLEAIGFFKDANDIANSPIQQFSEVTTGSVKYKDQNTDGIIDANDMIPIGYSPLPEMNFSFNLGAEYKNLGFNALIQGVSNNTVYLNTVGVFWPLRGTNNISSFSDNYWTPETAQTATLPMLTMQTDANDYRQNSIWLVDGSFVKLRQAEIYYSLPESVFKRFKLTKVRFYLRGMNLFSNDNINILDPEALGATYPTQRAYYLGVNVGF